MNAFSRDTAPALVEESEEVVLQKVASLIACYERKGEPENAARMRGVMQLRGQALREAREAEIVRLCNSVLGHLIAGGATEEAAYWARVMHPIRCMAWTGRCGCVRHPSATWRLLSAYSAESVL